MVGSLFFPLFFLSVVQGPTSFSHNRHLKALEFLVGGHWTAEGEISGFGNFVAERSYTWSLDSNFIEQRHTMKIGDHRIEALGILGWDVQKNQVIAYGFGNDGGIATTVAVFEKNKIVFQGSRQGGFNPGPTKGTFDIKNRNEYIESVEVQKEGKWVPSFSFHWIRVTK